MHEKMNEKAVAENLREIKDVLDKNGIEFWLDGGTLLGAVRDGKIIEWDWDVDLGTWYDNIKQITSTFPELKKRGFNVSLRRQREIVLATKSDCTVDITLYRKRGDYAWRIWIIKEWIIKEKRWEKKVYQYIGVLAQRKYAKPEGKFILRCLMRFSPLLPLTLKQPFSYITSLLDRRASHIPVVVPKRYFEKLSTMQFYGMQFYVPYDVEKYLEFRFGSNWKMPTKKWIYYKDDGAINLNWAR